MKIKLLVLTLVIGTAITAGTVIADIGQETIDSLDNAKELLFKKDYSRAVEEIEYALSKINEIQAERLVAYVPDAPKGFNIESKSSQGLGQAGAIVGGAGTIMAEARYIGLPPSQDTNNKKNKKDQNDEENADENYNAPYINLKISVGGIMGKMGSMSALGKMFGGSAGNGVKSVRVKGYTGVLEYSKENKSGTLTVQVGEKVSVTLEGSYIGSGDILVTIANSMKLQELVTNF